MKSYLFITLFLLAACSDEIHMRPAAIVYPAPAANLAPRRAASLQRAIEWSVDDQEAINNIDWSSSK